MLDPTSDAKRLAELALAEDGERDITTEITGAEGRAARAPIGRGNCPRAAGGRAGRPSAAN